MLKELLKLAAAGLGAALAEVAQLVMSGGAVTGAIVLRILAGTVLVRIAMWVVATFGPKPAAPPVEASSRSYR